MKSLKERFEENYAAVESPADNKDGFKIKYVYYAPWYLWDCPEKLLKEKKLRMLIASLVGFAAYIAAGVQPCEANTSLLVGVPALLGLCAHVVELFGLALFCCAKYRTTKMTYGDVDWTMTIGPMARVGMMVLSSLFSLVFLFTGQMTFPELTAAGGYLFSGITALYISKNYRALPLKTERNDMLDKLAAEGRLH